MTTTTDIPAPGKPTELPLRSALPTPGAGSNPDTPPPPGIGDTAEIPALAIVHTDDCRTPSYCLCPTQEQVQREQRRLQELRQIAEQIIEREAAEVAFRLLGGLGLHHALAHLLYASKLASSPETAHEWGRQVLHEYRQQEVRPC